MSSPIVSADSAATSGQAASTSTVVEVLRLQHQLSNQLTIALGFTELLLRNPALPAQLGDFANQAHEGVRQATSTLRSLEELTRLLVSEQPVASPVAPPMSA